MNAEELKALRTRLKSGNYDGKDIMGAWLAIDRLIEALSHSAAEPVDEAKFEELLDTFMVEAMRCTNEAPNNRTHSARQALRAYVRSLQSGVAGANVHALQSMEVAR